MSLTDSHPPLTPVQVRDALKSRYSAITHESPLAGLLLVQQVQTAQRVSLRRAGNLVLDDALARLEEIHPKQAALLRRRFIKDKSVAWVAQENHVAEATLYKHQQRAIEFLTAVLNDLEEALRTRQVDTSATRLPPFGAGRLFGIEPFLHKLVALLTAPHAPAVTLITGMGGQGKSTAARAAVNTVLRTSMVFAEAAWISAQQETFYPSGVIQRIDHPALTADDLLMQLSAQVLPEQSRTASLAERFNLLRAYLQQTPTLVVVDNLETVLDVQALLPMLFRLAGASRFLLTSRKALPGEDNVCHLVAPELSAQDALALVRYEAQMRNLTVITAASDEDLLPIYHTVGGNALALKLIVGQLYSLALPEVLDGLREAHGAKAAQLYRYIYWRSWKQLPPRARDVLLCMPHFAHTGAELRSIERICDVKGPELQMELEQLVLHSLVMVDDGLLSKRYRVHRLTETFLMREAIRWQGYNEDWDGDILREA